MWVCQERCDWPVACSCGRACLRPCPTISRAPVPMRWFWGAPVDASGCAISCGVGCVLGIKGLNLSKGDLRFVRPDAAGYMPPGRWHQHGKLMPGIRASRLLLQPIHNDGITDAKCGNKQLIIKLYGGVGAGRGRREQAHGREDKTFSLENVHWFSS